MVESLDADRDNRLLSPMAILGTAADGTDYINLINGPQDHGTCAEEACRRRLSLFGAVVATGEWYTVIYTIAIVTGCMYILPGTILLFPVVGVLEELVPCSLHGVHTYMCVRACILRGAI